MKKDEMTNVERIRATLNFEPVDRLPMIEWAGWWKETTDRWIAEGMPEGMSNIEIQRFFGLDTLLQDWINPRGKGCPTPAGHGAGILSTEAEYVRLKEMGALFPSDPVNVERWAEWARVQDRGETALWFTLLGPFWFPRTLFGIERHLYAFYDQPELMKRMNQDLTDFNLRVIEQFCSICKPVFMTFAEDMSYNHGPMISEALFDEFMLPYYLQLTPRLKELGVKIIVDSDGDISACASWFERAGVEGILPLERQAGVDVVALRRKHPRQLYIGAFDKMVMNRGEAAIRAELERLAPLAGQGGMMISCDHQTPPGVSLEDYRLYVRLFREYAGA